MTNVDDKFEQEYNRLRDNYDEAVIFFEAVQQYCPNDKWALENARKRVKAAQAATMRWLRGEDV